MARYKAYLTDRRRVCFRLFLPTILGILLINPALADVTRRVLIVNPYDNALPVAGLLEAGIRREMQSELRDLEIYTEFLDIERFPGPQYAARLAAFLRDKYAGRRIDLVIAMAPEGLDFLMQRRKILFPESQLMFTRLTEDELRVWHVPMDLSGIVSRYDPAPTVDLALHLEPDATRLIILAGTTGGTQHEVAVTPDRLKAFAHRLKITYWSNLAMADLMRDVGRLPHGTLVLDLGIDRDGAGQLFIPRDVDENLAGAASVPLYGGYETWVGHGNVGGNVEDFEAEGRQTGRLAVRLLNEHPVGQRMVAPTHTMVDWRQLCSAGD